MALSDNMVVNYTANTVNYTANTVTFVYRSTMSQNVRHIMFKYNMAHRELLYMPMSASNYKCKEIKKCGISTPMLHTMNTQNEL